MFNVRTGAQFTRCSIERNEIESFITQYVRKDISLNYAAYISGARWRIARDRRSEARTAGNLCRSGRVCAGSSPRAGPEGLPNESERRS
jgi:hypothetical protein